MTRSLLLIVLLSATAWAAELDLYVTDYNEDQSLDQKPLIARPIVYAKPQEVTLKTADGETVAIKSPDMVTVKRELAGNPREAKLFASLGEYEPFSFLLRPRVSLEKVFIAGTDLTGPGGTIPAANVVVTSVEGFHGKGRDILMRLGNKWSMGAHTTEFFWCTVQVPSDAKPGLYKGEVVVTASDKPIGSLAIALEVLPIKLDEPPYALGYNYSSPKDAKALAAHLADQRAHGMTTVAPLYNFHLPIHDTDTSELGDFIEAYKKAGFPATLYYATPMGLTLSDLAGYGDEQSKRWQQKFIQVMRQIHAEIQKHGVPTVVSIGDELTNKGADGVKIAGRLARFIWEEMPEVATTSDMNGYGEVMAMAPYLNVATFNNGWDGIDHHNKGRQLINRTFIQELQRTTGAIPWFVNAGTGRFPYGFFFWKMAKYGVRGKVEWYYNLNNEQGSVVRTDGATVYPTLDYERSREGIDDLRYLCTLERLVAEAKKAGRAAAEVAKAEDLLKSLADAIKDDWTMYTSGGERFPADGFDVLSPDRAAAMPRLDSLRRAVADRIVAVQEAVR
jgi:hypothetical protein